MAQNPTRPRQMAELGQSQPAQEEEAAESLWLLTPVQGTVVDWTQSTGDHQLRALVSKVPEPVTTSSRTLKKRSQSSDPVPVTAPGGLVLPVIGLGADRC
jgi:hypothetical protein